MSIPIYMNRHLEENKIMLDKKKRFKEAALAFSFISYIFGEGNGTPLQYSCLENPMDGGGCWEGCSPWNRKSGKRVSG